MIKLHSLLFISCIVFLGLHCQVTNNENDKYLGTWVEEKNGIIEGLVEIYKDGNNYTFYGDVDGFLDDYKAGLKSEQDKLVLQGVPLMGEVPLVISTDGKTMLFGGKEFKFVRRSTAVPYMEFINNLNSTLSKHHFEEFNCTYSANCECWSQYSYSVIQISPEEMERCKLSFRELDEKSPGWRDVKLLDVAVASPHAIFESNKIAAVVAVRLNTFQGITKTNHKYQQTTIAITEDEGKTWKFLGLGDVRDKASVEKLKMKFIPLRDAITSAVELARKQFDEQYGPQKWDE